jgi:predicted RNA-binding protein with TRAM domain
MSFDQVNTLVENGFQFTAEISEVLSYIKMRIYSFESVSNGRSLIINIRSGAGLSGSIIFNIGYIINNTSDVADITFNIPNGPTLTIGDVYTLTIQDVTSGGTSTGSISIYGVTQNGSTLVSYNTNVYPKIIIGLGGPISIWEQPSDIGFSERVSTTGEQGYRFFSLVSGTMSVAYITLVSFYRLFGDPSPTTASRNLRIRIRDGDGLSGTIIYTNDFNILNTRFTSDKQVKFKFSISNGPILANGNTYTITVQDVTSNGFGYINIYGIQIDPLDFNFQAYGSTNVYPQLEIFADTGGNSIVYNQSSATVNNNFSFGENGFRIIPTSSGRLLSISQTINTSSQSLTYRFRVRDGEGLNGNILFEQDNYTFNESIFTSIIFSCGTNGPFLVSGTTYTYSLEVISGGSNNDSQISGILPTSTYVVYNSPLYTQSSVNVANGDNVKSQPTDDTSTQRLSVITEQGFRFVPNETIDPNSFIVKLQCFNETAQFRDINIKIRDGAGIGGAILFTLAVSIPVSTINKRENVEVILNSPTLTSGGEYTLTFQDITTQGEANGDIYLYGIVQNATYISYNTETYPFLFILRDNIYKSLLQGSAQISESVVTTNFEQGFQIIPSSSGSLSNIIINISSFEAADPGRLLNLIIRDGSGLSGTIIYNQAYILNNNLNSSDINFQIVSPIPFLISGNIYTVTIQDITSGGTNTGFIFSYGIYGNNTNIIFNTIIYPRLNILFDSSTLTYEQLASPTISSVISNVTEQGFRFVPSQSGLLNHVIFTMTSFGSNGLGRTLTMKVRLGAGTSGVILFDEDVMFANSLGGRTDYDVYLTVPPAVFANGIYTISLIDISAGGTSTGDITIYGISPNTTYDSYNISTYPKISIFVPSYLITLSPPQNYDGFIADNTDNIEFNSKARENSSILLSNGNPSHTSMYKVGLVNLVIPNQLLDVGMGGKLDNYPYVYVQLFNEGNKGSLKTITSNNPHSVSAIFKMPIKQYLYDNPTSFFTLKTSTRDQIIMFRPDQDVRIRITLPDGTPISTYQKDSLSPLNPNPFLQFNALFTILSMTR